MASAPTSRDKILDVAEALFARRGYSGVGMREVAESAGLGKSSLFHHFRGKAQLYGEVLTRVLERIGERLTPVATGSEPPWQTLERSVAALIDALAEQPTTARLLLRALFEDDELPVGSPDTAPAERALATILGDVEALLRRGVDEGAFRSVSVPHTLQTLIGATVYHFASAEIGEGILGGPIFGAEAVARRKREVIDLLRGGLRAPAPNSSEPA